MYNRHLPVFLLILAAITGATSHPNFANLTGTRWPSAIWEQRSQVGAGWTLRIDNNHIRRERENKAFIFFVAHSTAWLNIAAIQSGPGQTSIDTSLFDESYIPRSYFYTKEAQ
jgi:hypothetical protein